MAAAPETLDLLDFIHAGPSPFHAVAEVSRRLDALGFEALDEGEAWSLQPGGRYRVVRGETTIAAFVLGTKGIEEAGIHACGAHTDSPNLRLKPKAAQERHGYRLLGVEVYGGVLLKTWIDRDLGLSGRVVIEGEQGRREVLVRSDEPLARIPELAIHLDRDSNTKGVEDRQNGVVPVTGLVSDEPGFCRWLEAQAGVKEGEIILSGELMMHVVEPPTLGGIDGEFVFAPRLDNLASCHAILTALGNVIETETEATRLFVFYDHEEIGSSTAQGAAGSFLSDILDRIAEGDAERAARARSRSSFLSIDMAHAVHPHRADRHDPDHQPRLNGGPCIKYNANFRYATDARTAAHFHALGREAGVPVQEFVMRNDLPCGSTIGPMVETRLGIAAVDVGNPMLSMHSAREMCGAADQPMMIRLLERYYS